MRGRSPSMASSNQRPVLKGIETHESGCRFQPKSSNQRPVLKGIETSQEIRANCHTRGSNQRPVLKGIETPLML